MKYEVLRCPDSAPSCVRLPGDLSGPRVDSAVGAAALSFLLTEVFPRSASGLVKAEATPWQDGVRTGTHAHFERNPLFAFSFLSPLCPSWSPGPPAGSVSR